MLSPFLAIGCKRGPTDFFQVITNQIHPRGKCNAYESYGHRRFTDLLIAWEGRGQTPERDGAERSRIAVPQKTGSRGVASQKAMTLLLSDHRRIEHPRFLRRFSAALRDRTPTVPAPVSHSVRTYRKWRWRPITFVFLKSWRQAPQRRSTHAPLLERGCLRFRKIGGCRPVPSTPRKENECCAYLGETF
jgi:hypothetical protein